MAAKLVKSPRIDEYYACFRLKIRKSKIHRFGVYADEPIPANRKVIEYTGERISRRESKVRASAHLTYLFELDSYWNLDGAVGGSGAEMVNHCCDPNLRSTILRGHILFVSRRAIRPGEELTLDYRFVGDIGEIKCFCGAKNCRGAINLK
jgi:SET domain-containing protein